MSAELSVSTSVNVEVFSDSAQANAAAADHLAGCLLRSGTRNLMVAGGNTPLELYRLIAQRSLPLGHVNVFALDEYVGVPQDHPRNCGKLLLRSVVEAWRIPSGQFYSVSTQPSEAPASIQAHERRIVELGGLDVIVLGLGQNGHLGFNEPGSAFDSVGRLVELEPASVNANRDWFGGEFAPARGVTAGLRTILSARTILILAYGIHKAGAAANMIEGPRNEACPASSLQGHANTTVFLDSAAASRLRRLTREAK